MRWPFLLALLSACTSFGVGAASSSSSSSGGNEAPDASVRDSASRSSSSSSSSSGADGSTTTADAGGFCTGIFFVCDEFERSDLLSDQWPAFQDDKGPDADPSIGTPVPPFSGQAVHFSLGRDSPDHKFLNRTNTSLDGATTLIAEMEFLPPPPGRQFNFVTIVLNAPDGSGQYVSLFYTAGGSLGGAATLINAPKTNNDFGQSPVLAAGVWQHITVTVTLGGANQSSFVTSTLNGTSWVANEEVAAIGADAADQVSLSIGPDAAMNGPPVDFWLDSVKLAPGL